GALVILVLKPKNLKTTYGIGIGTSALAFISSVLIWLRGIDAAFSQVEQLSWIPSLGIAYRLGVDGISFPIVILTTFLFLTALIYSAKIEKRANTYVMLFLMLEMACLGVFMSLDLVLFYGFFEITLLRMYFIIAE